MLTIRPDQIAALEADYRRRRRVDILRQIRVRPEGNAAGLDEAEALYRIDAAIEDGKAIGITRPDEVLRLAALAFLPDPVRTDPGFTHMVTRVLCRTEWEPAQRLDFIENHVIPALALTSGRSRLR